MTIIQGWPNFLDRGPFFWTKARATPHCSIFSLSCRYVLWFFFKSSKIDVRAKMMCSLKFGTKENKKPKKMTILEMVYDGYWIVLSCVWWSSKKKFHIYVFFFNVSNSSAETWSATNPTWSGSILTDISFIFHIGLLKRLSFLESHNKIDSRMITPMAQWDRIGNVVVGTTV